MLEQWLAAGEVAPPDRTLRVQTVYAVTPSLREWYHDADLDELEHAAQVAASIGSLELLAARPIERRGVEWCWPPTSTMALVTPGGGPRRPRCGSPGRSRWRAGRAH